MNKEALYEAGYRIGRPYWGLIDGSSIDEQVCRESVCENCGHEGLLYAPFVRDNPRSYIAYAVCPECGSSHDF